MTQIGPIGTKHALSAGQIVADRYEILSFIGSGAMGAVYKAKHKAMGRLFAVKTLHAASQGDERSKKRFDAEAQAMSVLTHPNLIQISDYGQTEDGTPFFVMEYLEGVSLADYIKRNGPLPLDRAIPIFAQIADGLAHAHSKSLIHRDLKPSNIMLIGDNRDFAKVVDLGIAKVVSEDEDMRQSLTQTGEVFGSPLYMSPEQISGSQMDARTDIYSLGCLMYEALTARPPLKGETFVQTAYKHMNEMPSPLHEVRSDVPADLEELIVACLAKKPEERLASMGELRDKLRALSLSSSGSQERTVLSAAVAERPLTALPPPQRLRLAATMAGLVAACLVGAVAVLYLMKLVAPPAQTTQTQAAQQSQTAPALPASFDTNSTISIESPAFARDNPGAPEEVDVVGVYTAQPYSETVGKTSDPVAQNVEVRVRAKKDPITLILFSYMPVHWSVKPYAGATIKKVIASGYHPQEVAGASCNDVTKVCSKNHDDNAFHTALIFSANPADVEKNRDKVFADITDGVKKILGPQSEIRHFRGRYYGTNFEI